MKNWRTTLLGILSIVAAVANAGVGWLNGQPIDFTALVAAILAGWGLIAAADAKP